MKHWNWSMFIDTLTNFVTVSFIISYFYNEFILFPIYIGVIVCLIQSYLHRHE